MATKQKKTTPAKKARTVAKHSAKTRAEPINQFATVMVPVLTALSIVFLLVVIQNYL